MELVTIPTKQGNINISRMTIETIARLVLCEMKEVVGPKKTIFQEITNKLIKSSTEQSESISQEIKIEIKKDAIIMNLYLMIIYGIRIPDLTWKIQSRIKEKLKKYTGLNVNEINVHIQGIHYQNKDHFQNQLTASELFVKIF